MKKIINTTHLIIYTLILTLIIQGFATAATTQNTTTELPTNYSAVESQTLTFTFSDPIIITQDGKLWVHVNETDLNMIIPHQPILPTNITELQFEFGTKIHDIAYNTSTPENITIPNKLTLGKPSPYDLPSKETQVPPKSTQTSTQDTPYPLDWYTYHTGGGLSYSEHCTFMILRVFPVRYFHDQQQLQFIRTINITITYQTPSTPVLTAPNIYDLLIIAPTTYTKALQKLVIHKNANSIKTRLVSLPEIYNTIYWEGRDSAEKIKYYIKNAIEYWGITHVLLVGGLKHQTFSWTLPVRYSHVVPPDEQEYAEASFLSDLYYADIYNSTGNFSSWDSNHNNIFAEWNETYKETMDNYPDVYLGRLPCRNTREVRIMVNKIIKYENQQTPPDWFYNLVLVAGDSYNDTNHFNEGELISEEAITLMPGFTPVKVYASADDINRRTVNKAMNPGSGFAYFVGHGSPMSWSTHFPPNGKKWTTGYEITDMPFLRNRHKLPVVVVGGCHNGQFDVTMMNILQGIKEDGLHYFSSQPGNFGRFWWNEWVPNCWSWWLTSQRATGAIATISNTGLGTHGDGDQDNNGIADYLEVLDGWLELRFLQLYGEEHHHILGENHGQTLTEYLHRFLGNNDKMDVKMVQQWELMGDPTLQIGG